MSEPFSIVIPIYNRASVLERTLRSVSAQSYRPLHLILVDNNSTDESASVMRRWAEENRSELLHISLLQERKPGAAAARNCGLRCVKSDYMLFFDSDDEMHPEAVSNYMQAFQSLSHPDIVTSRCVRIDSHGKHHYEGGRKGDTLITHIHHCTLRTQGFAIRTSLIRSVGGWNEETRIWDDWELGIRLLTATNHLMHCHFTSCYIHTSAISLTGAQYSEKHTLYEAPITAAEYVLSHCSRPDKDRLLFLMKYRRMMLAGLYAREGHKDLSEPLRRQVLSGVSGKQHTLLSFAYHYISRGGRGYDRLLSLLT